MRWRRATYAAMAMRSTRTSTRTASRARWQASRLSKSIHWRVRLGTFDAICKLVERGVGVAVIPERAAAKAQLTGNFVRIRLSDSWAKRQLMLCVRSLEELPRHARQLVDHILSKTIE